MKIIVCKTPAEIIDTTARVAAENAGDIKKPVYVFCESRATLSFERKISEIAGGAFNVNVLGFSRYVYLNAGKKEYLSKSASSLVVRRIMGEKRAELTRFKDCDYRFAPAAYELISQLKSAKVKPEDLDGIIDGEGGAFGGKLKDLRIIYGGYEKFIADKALTDESTFLSLMPEILKTDEKIRGAKVLIGGISSLTRQTTDFVIALEKFCDLTYVLLKGEKTCYTNEVFEKLLRLFPTAEVIENDYPRSKEARLMEKWLFNPMIGKEEGSFSDKIKIFELENPKAEAETIAKRIRYEVVKNGRRYNDFCIAVPDVKAYAEACEDVFASYGVPFYADVKKPLSSHPAARLFSSLMRLKKQNIPPLLLAETIKNPLVDADKGEEAEEYILKNAVGRKNVREPFDCGAEDMRKKIVSFVDSIRQKAAVGEYCKAIIDLYADLCVKDKAEELKKKFEEKSKDALGYFATAGLDDFLQVVNEAAVTAGDVTVSADEFAEMISAGVEAKETAMLPQFYDGVFMGDFVSVRQRVAKILFVAGLTSDVPLFKADASLLSDRELFKMDGYKCVVEPKIRVLNKREKENVATTLMSFSNALYLTYPRADFFGAAVKPSPIIDDIVKTFSCGKDSLKIRDIEAERAAKLTPAYGVYDYVSVPAGLKTLCRAAEDYRDGNACERGIASSFAAALKGVDEEAFLKAVAIAEGKEEVVLVPELSYGERVSATALERYFACPYAGFADNRLKLKQRDTGEIESNELGTLLHYTLEKFAPLTEKTERENVKQTADEIFERAIEEVGFEKYRGKARFTALLNLVKEEAEKRCLSVYDEIKNGTFKVSGAETEFGDSPSAKYPALRLTSPYGIAKLRGKIDRIDECEEDLFGEKAKYARIVDYKTGSVDNKDSDESLYSGRSIQLYLYLNVLTRAGYRPAGAYYYKVDDSFTAKGEDGTGYFGKGIRNVSVMRKMDSTVADDGGESKTFSFKTAFDKETGEIIVKKSKNVLDEKDLASYARYAKKVAESGVGEMMRGSIVASPYEETCTYCKYKGLCGYDAAIGKRTRKVKKVDSETIITNAGEDDE